MSIDRKVVITGIGVVTPVGKDLVSFWDSLTNGRSGIDRISAFDPECFDCQIAGEVKDFNPTPFFKNPKDVRRTDRFTQFGMAAAKMAMADSGVDLEKVNLNRFGCIIGSGIGGLKTLCDQHTILMNKGPNRVSPFMIPMMISNMASGIISMEFGYRGPNFAVVTACATANQCIGEAWRIIRTGDADAIVAGGSEAAVVPLGIGGFAAMKALSTRNDEPTRASRPFDKDRDGFVMGEGAGVVVLEELEHAVRRGAHILAELTGYGITADAYHMTSPSPEGAGGARAVISALKHAQLNPEQIDYINAHGTSTGQGDICETQGIKSVFGQYAKKVMVSSTKSMTGHLLGAAGSVELIACIKAIETGIVPPTINLDNPDPECDLDYVPNKAREAKVTRALNNSFGFGGHNASVIVEKFI